MMPTSQSDREAVSREFQRRYAMLAFAAIGDFGAVLAVPAILAAFLGTRIDGHFGSRPLGLAVCLAIAAVLSGLAVRKRAASYGRRYQELADREKEALKGPLPKEQGM